MNQEKKSRPGEGAAIPSHPDGVASAKFTTAIGDSL
jgi:hypothetical protein